MPLDIWTCSLYWWTCLKQCSSTTTMQFGPHTVHVLLIYFNIISIADCNKYPSPPTLCFRSVSYALLVCLTKWIATWCVLGRVEINISWETGGYAFHTTLLNLRTWIQLKKQAYIALHCMIIFITKEDTVALSDIMTTFCVVLCYRFSRQKTSFPLPFI